MVEGTQRSESRKEVSLIWITALYSIFLISLIVLDDMGKLKILVRLMKSLQYGDKFIHFFLIGALSFLVNRVVAQFSRGRSSERMSIIATVILLVIFTVEEASQIFFPGRTASFSDLTASYAGIVVFALLALWIDGKIKSIAAAKSA